MYAMSLEVDEHFQDIEVIKLEVVGEVILPLDSKVLMAKQTLEVWVWLEEVLEVGIKPDLEVLEELVNLWKCPTSKH
jgi:hypothetical protein